MSNTALRSNRKIMKCKGAKIRTVGGEWMTTVRIVVSVLRKRQEILD